MGKRVYLFRSNDKILGRKADDEKRNHIHWLRSFEKCFRSIGEGEKKVKTAVNLSMVYAYYEIGRMIVEEEQHGENRAEYGK